MTAHADSVLLRAALAVSVLLFSGCREEILHDLNELQANRVLVILTQSGISAAKRREGGGWAVSVQRERTAEALEALDSRRINRRELRRFTEQSKGILQSREERSRFLERQAAWSLEQTLESIPGVLEAHAHLYSPAGEDASFEDSKGRMSASVLIVSNDKHLLNTGDLQRLVSGASGIAAERVVVVVSKDGAAAAAAVPDAGNARAEAVSKPDQRRLAAAGSAVLASLALAALILSVRKRRLRPESRLSKVSQVEADVASPSPAQEEVF